MKKFNKHGLMFFIIWTLSMISVFYLGEAISIEFAFIVFAAVIIGIVQGIFLISYMKS